MTNISLSSALKCASITSLAVILGCGPRDGVKEFTQAKAAYELRDFKRAEKLLEKSIECAPEDVDRVLYLARVKLDLGELTSARDLANRAVALSNGDVDTKLLQAQVSWHCKDYAEAAAVFTSIANDKSLSAELRSQAWAGLGVVEMTNNNNHLSRVAFLSAIRLDRKNAAAWYHLGLLYRDGFGYLEAALEQLEIFVRLEASASPRVQKVQRVTIPAIKDSIARELSSRPGASKRNSAACSTLISKAESAWKKGTYKTARQLYQDALAADSLSYPAAKGLADAWIKTDATKEGLNKAFDNYKRACALSPSRTSIYLTTGALATRIGLTAQACEIYSRAVAASPTSQESLDGLIRSLRKMPNKGKIAQAYQKYRDLISIKRK